MSRFKDLLSMRGLEQSESTEPFFLFPIFYILEEISKEELLFLRVVIDPTDEFLYIGSY